MGICHIDTFLVNSHFLFSTISVVMESSETSIAQAFWFIGMMVAIAVLILFLIVVCFFKRSRGEKYHGKLKAYS